MEEFGVISTRNNATRAKVNTFTFELLESLKHRITLLNTDENEKRYAILIDGDMIVSPTTDVERFDDYLKFIDQTCSILEVRLFHKDSPNCVPHKFTLKDSVYFGTPPKNGLGEIEINEKIEQAIQSERQESKIALLQAKIEQITKMNDQLKEENKTLIRKLKKVKKSRAKLYGSMNENKTDYTDLIGKGIELFGIYQNAKNGAPPNVETTVDGVATVSIEPEKSETSTKKTEFDEVVDELKAEFSDDQLINAMRATELFANHPELKSEFQAIINAKLGGANTTG
ncbi:MAG: hypothetical protein HYZ42_13960 [Bacteroidetes bacterium]|nr:hypothetical protein [Bacteroidota bacterium]